MIELSFITALESNVMKMFNDGYSPSFIDKKLGLIEGDSKKIISNIWKCDKAMLY